MEIALMVLIGIVLLLLVLLLLKKGGEGPGTVDWAGMQTKLSELQVKILEIQREGAETQRKSYIESQQLLTEQLSRLQMQMATELSSNRDSIQSQLQNANTVISQVQNKLGVLEKTASNIENIGKEVSSLQSILQAPKLRGNLGEYLLEDLLKQVLPSQSFQMQYSFKDGCKVDAVIKLSERLVPVDSKFPLESFQRLISLTEENERKLARKEFLRSLKNRIDEIAGKYIRPQEGTFDFALMYIPAENVFYEIMLKDSLSDKDFEVFNYAIQSRIIPVSPNSFYAYLTAIVFGLRGLQIEKKAEKIREDLVLVQESFLKFYEELQKAGRNLNVAHSTFENVLKRADKFNDKIGQVTCIQSELPSAQELIEK